MIWEQTTLTLWAIRVDKASKLTPHTLWGIPLLKIFKKILKNRVKIFGNIRARPCYRLVLLIDNWGKLVNVIKIFIQIQIIFLNLNRYFLVFFTFIALWNIVPFIRPLNFIII